MNNFNLYQSMYWEKGEGQLLWNLRKLTELTNYISSTDTPAPFITALQRSSKESGSSNWSGWQAIWTTKDNRDLEIEFEGTDLILFAFDKVGDYEFVYDFDLNKEFEFKKLLEAAEKARIWLLANHNEIYTNKMDSLKKVFNVL